jgi:phosphate transport system permease protein
MTATGVLEHEPLVPAEAPEEERIRLRRFDRSDAGALAGAAIAAFSLDWLVYERLTPLSGGLGFWVCWYLAFVVIDAVVMRDRHGWHTAKDRVAGVVVASAGTVLVVSLGFVLGYVVFRGYSALRAQFFTQTQEFVGPLSKATDGGGAEAIVGTLEQVGLATLICVPLGVLSAVFLNEVGGRMARPLRTVVDAMSAVPSILAGLFIYAAWILALHQSFSGFAGSLALSVLMLPIVTRTAEVVLRLVPGGLREGALALGGTEWRVARLVVLPTARVGLVTAVILGIARVVGETAPLILTTFGAFRMNANPFRGAQSSLPLFVWSLYKQPQAAQVQRAWTGALVLVILVLALFVLARIIGGRGPGHVGFVRRWRQRHGRSMAT